MFLFTLKLANLQNKLDPCIPNSHTTFYTIHTNPYWYFGSTRIKILTNAKWFVTFIYDHTRTAWVYLRKEKSEVVKVFQSFHIFVWTQFNTFIKILWSDNVKEYINGNFKEFFDQQGIHHQTSHPYTPQQNGVAKQKNCHLFEVT